MAAIYNVLKWFRVLNHNANDLLALVTIKKITGWLPDYTVSSLIDKYATNAGGATNIIYTVPENKILFISSAWVSARASAVSSGHFGIAIRNDEDDFTVYLLFIALNASSIMALSNQYRPAIQVPAGYDVYNYSEGASITGETGFSGWLESA